MDFAGSIVRRRAELVDRCLGSVVTTDEGGAQRGAELGRVIDAIAVALARADGASWAACDAVVARYASARLHDGLTLVALLDELGALARALVMVCGNDEGGDLRPLHEAVLRAMSTAGAVYAHHLREAEAADERCARRLDACAPGETVCDEPLLCTRAAEACRDGLEASRVVIVLVEPAHHRMVVAGVAGGEALPIDAAVDPVLVDAAVSGGPGLERAVLHLGFGRGDQVVGAWLCAQRRPLGAIIAARSDGRPCDRRRLATCAARVASLLEQRRLRARLADLTTQATRCDETIVQNERLAASLAHDLRGPLHAARLQVELAFDRDSITGSVPARRILRSLDRLDRMLCDMLDVHRLRAGEVPSLQVARCDLVELVHEIVEDLDPREQRRVIIEARSCVEGMWSVEELRRAIWNLVDNALKHGAREAPVTIRVSGDAERASVVVHNRGPRIPQNEAARIFEPFGRGRGAGCRGWGLGLASVRTAVEAHGGRVVVDSRVDDGAAFVVWLPRIARGLPKALAAGPAIEQAP